VIDSLPQSGLGVITTRMITVASADVVRMIDAQIRYTMTEIVIVTSAIDVARMGTV
jgi:hypothetical protein